MEMMIFYESSPDGLCEQVNSWLDKNNHIEILEIKQTALPPDNVSLNSEKLHSSERIEHEAFLIITVWYESHGQGEKDDQRQRIVKKN